MRMWKYKNIQIWKYINIHVEKYKCEKCKRECKESKYIYIKNYKVTSNRNVNKETNKQKKRKYAKIAIIWKCVCVYIYIYIYIYIHTYKHENIQIYKNVCRNYLCKNIEYIKSI